MSSNTLPNPSLSTRLRSIPSIWLWVNILLLASVTSLIFIPQLQTVIEKKKALGESQAQAHIIQNATTANATGQKDSTTLLDNTILQTALLPEDHVVQFVEVFEKAASDTGVTQQIELTSSQRVVQRGVVHIPMQMTLTGTWEGMMRFIAELEHSDLYINITAITMAPESTLSSKYTATISAITFWKQLL